MPTREQVNLDAAQVLANKQLNAPLVAAGTATADPAVPLGLVTKQYVDAVAAPGAGSRVLGANGKNNTVTPSSQYDLSALQVILFNPSNSGSVVRANPVTVTNNILAGPAANGRDQAGAFPSSSWIHLYWIWNGTTLASLSSADPPSVGPVLPSGYTHWAYAVALYLGPSALFENMTVLRGAWVCYVNAVNLVISVAMQTAEQTLPTTTQVPPNALELQLSVWGYNAATGVTANTIFRLRYVSGNNFQSMQQVAGAVNSFTPFGFSVRMPATGDVYFLYESAANFSAGQTVIDVVGYKIPNGGE